MEEKNRNIYFFYFKKKKNSANNLPYTLCECSENEFLKKWHPTLKNEVSLFDFAKLVGIDEKKLQLAITKKKKKQDLNTIKLDEKNFFCNYYQFSSGGILIQLEEELEEQRKPKKVLLDEKHEKYLELINQNNKEAISILKVTQNKVEYLYHNRQHAIISGFDDTQIKGKKLNEVLGETYYKKYEEEIIQCAKKEKTTIFKAKACWNGQVIERLCRLDPIEEEDSYVMASEIELNVVKQWIIENKLSITRFDEMFHSHQSVMLLIEPNTGKIVDANPAASKFYGYSNKELTSMTIQKINTLLDSDVERKRDSALGEKCQYFLFRHRLKNGEIRLVDVHSSPIEINEHKYLFSIISDATQRESNEGELYKEKELQKITMDSIADSVVTTDINGKITYFNKAAEMAVEWKLNDAMGKNFDEVFYMTNEMTSKKIESIVQIVLNTQKSQELENYTLLHTKTQKQIPIEDSAAPIKDKNGNIYGVVVVFRDVTLAKEKKKKIEYLSYHDSLTGLYNRRYYYEYIDSIHNAYVYPLGFIMGDVNGLKMTNDVFGHDLGDKLLTLIAKTLCKEAKDKNMVVRWGGDEFIIVLPNTSEKKMEDLILRIKSSLEQLKLNEVMEVSISFGTALKKYKWESSDKILKEAEELMYQNKLLESKSMRGNTISALLTTLDEKSEETKEHTLRLAKTCKQIAEKLHQHAEGMSRLSLLSVLHDIGKVGVPDNILGKPGALNSEEWEIMRTHSEIGYRIALNVPELNLVANEILHHHEKWDGTGYPSGLKGKQIPINCRILSVVDAI